MTSGRADAVLKAIHITRCRYAHQVSACALYILQRKAYENGREENADDSCNQDFDGWIATQKKSYPQFMYWSTALELELIVFEVVRSIREGIV